MKLLAFDCAAAACSVAVWAEGRVAVHRVRVMERGHSEVLVPMIREVMDAACVGFRDLDAIAVTIGPGAFTGLRIGLATARGMALASGRPCLGVTTLEAVAAGVPEAEAGGDPILVVLDAKRADLYAQAFSPARAPLGEPSAVAPTALAGLVPGGRVLLAGDARALARPALESAGLAVRVAAVERPDAAVVAALAAGRWTPGMAPPPPPRPLYLRAPDVTPPRRASG